MCSNSAVAFLFPKLSLNVVGVCLEQCLGTCSGRQNLGTKWTLATIRMPRLKKNRKLNIFTVES